MRILLVDDDPILVEALTKSLLAQCYSIDAVSDGTAAWNYISQIDYDLILLDILLPNLDGVSLCRRIRAEQNETPILILTGQQDSRSRVRGLDAGADDYLVKPFDLEELLARIRALIRRSGADLSPIFQLGQLVFDPAHGSASYEGIPLSLSAKEFALLELFFHDPHHVFSVTDLLDSLWSSEEYPAEATVRSHIRRLRNKLIAAGAPPNYISNIHGRGYFLNAHDNSKQPLDQEAMIDEQQLIEPNSPHLSKEAQYQSFLQETWHQFQPKALQDLDTLEELLNKIQSPRASVAALESAHLIAHRLKGTLSLFQLPLATDTAQWIEHALESLISPNQLYSGHTLAVTDLKPHLQNLRDLLSLMSPITPPNLVAPQTPHAPTPQISECENSPHRVSKALIVDDDEHWLQCMALQLQNFGFQISPLADPHCFWQTLEATQPDILLLDFKMPQISGLELCQTIRSHPTWQSLPIIFVSAQTDQTTQLSAFTAGADDYLCKPLLGADLAHRMVTRLKRTQTLLTAQTRVR